MPIWKMNVCSKVLRISVLHYEEKCQRLPWVCQSGLAEVTLHLYLFTGRVVCLLVAVKLTKIYTSIVPLEPLTTIKFATRARSRDFLRSSLRIASKVNQSGWAILSHDFSKRPSMDPGRNKVEVPHRRDRRKKKLPGVSASIGGENSWRLSLAIKFAAIGA